MKKYSHNYGDYEIKKEYPSIHSKLERNMKKISTQETEEAKENIKELLSSWDHKGKVVSDLGLRYGYRREEVQVETQFGNIARYYNDVMKMELARQDEVIRFGILIVPSHERCQKMSANVADFHRIEKELKEMRGIIQIPLIVYGI